MNTLPCRLLGSVLAAIAVGCGGTVDDAVVCTAEVRSSVVVAIVDANGVPLPGATVNWRVDGGPLQAATCIAVPAGCSSFFAGQEISGEFTISAEKTGWRPATAQVTVQRDVCHVITREVVLTLTPA